MAPVMALGGWEVGCDGGSAKTACVIVPIGSGCNGSGLTAAVLEAAATAAAMAAAAMTAAAMGSVATAWSAAAMAVAVMTRAATVALVCNGGDCDGSFSMAASLFDNGSDYTIMTVAATARCMAVKGVGARSDGSSRALI